MTTAVLMEPLLVIHEALIYTKKITRVYIHKFVSFFSKTLQFISQTIIQKKKHYLPSPINIVDDRE